MLSTGGENDPTTTEINGQAYVIVYSHEDSLVDAQYAYLTGVATWTALMPREHRQWFCGHQPGNLVYGANHSSTKRTGRGISIPPDECTAQTLAIAL